jgi:hypothetical protein
MNAFCDLEMIFSNTILSMFARVLAIIRRGWGKFCNHTKFKMWEMVPMLDSGMIFGVGIRS